MFQFYLKDILNFYMKDNFQFFHTYTFFFLNQRLETNYLDGIGFDYELAYYTLTANLLLVSAVFIDYRFIVL